LVLFIVLVEVFVVVDFFFTLELEETLTVLLLLLRGLLDIVLFEVILLVDALLFNDLLDLLPEVLRELL